MANDLSIAQLERLLDKKKLLLDGLQRKRERLQQELAGVETRIAQIVAPPPVEPPPRKSQPRPRNDRKLRDIVTELLKANKKGLHLNDITDRVLATGYKVSSANFSNTVYQCLNRREDLFAYDSTSRLYRLK